MNKNDLVKVVALKTELSQKDAKKAIEAVLVQSKKLWPKMKRFNLLALVPLK